MWDTPSTQFMETYSLIKWAAENWKQLMNWCGSQYHSPDPDEAFLKNSIDMIEKLRKESYHICILMYLIQNMSLLSDSVYTAFFKTATWQIDEEKVNYFENVLLRELKAELESKQNKEKE